MIFETDVLRYLLEDPRETLALVDKYESWMDGTCIKIGENDEILSFVPGKKFVFEEIPSYYKTVNIYKFSRHFSITHYIPFLEAYSKALGNNEYYEQVLRVITMLDYPEIRAKRLKGQLWYEIDDIQDLDIASSMFHSNKEEKVNMIQKRFGGYWRYPKMIDFCYLVNPFFPPQRLVDEIKSNFETLLTQYPSGMQVNSLLAAKNFGVSQRHILTGNGAAELIKALLENLEGTLGIIRPTFEEYPNRYCTNDCVTFVPQNDDLAYSADDVIEHFTHNKIRNLLIINPDNPSGNYISKEDMIHLIDWAAKNKIQIIVDESFVDFADEKNNSLIHEKMLQQFPNLVVIKSISKSYGVPGLRLGVLASSNEALIEKLKKDVAIWNINSFGEFYMQIEEKYHKDYLSALDKIREVREEFINKLEMIKGIRVLPSQANFIMVELINGKSSQEITEKLLLAHNIFVKDLSGKISNKEKQYLRIAIRNEHDNCLLLKALNHVMNDSSE